MPTTNDAPAAGLFPRCLQSIVPPNSPPLTPILTLNLSLYSPNGTVAGHATVTFRGGPGAEAVVYQSYVTGTLTYGGPRVGGVATEALIDLTGYPGIINIPPGMGPGPVQMPNLKADLVMNKTITEGSVAYEFLQANQQWQRVEQQIAPCQ
jgi:hypothetical protein